MSNDTKKKEYKPLGKRVLIRCTAKTSTVSANDKAKGIVGIELPYRRDDYKDMLNRKKDVLFYDEFVVAVGEKVEIPIKPEQEVNVKHHGLVFLADDDLKRFGLPFNDNELYYLIEEEYILAVIN